jgi:hypothetical protein
VCIRLGAEVRRSGFAKQHSYRVAVFAAL